MLSGLLVVVIAFVVGSIPFSQLFAVPPGRRRPGDLARPGSPARRGLAGRGGAPAGHGHRAPRPPHRIGVVRRRHGPCPHGGPDPWRPRGAGGCGHPRSDDGQAAGGERAAAARPEEASAGQPPPVRQRHGARVTVAIVTDSAASIPPALLAQHDITVVPMRIIVGGEDHPDGVLPLSEVAGRAADGVSTSAPSPGEFARAIEASMTGDGVLVATVASTMSATFTAARLAGDDGSGKVRVVDTGTAAGAEGLVVLAAAERAAA